MNRTSGILPSTSTAMVMNSLRGENTSCSNSPLTRRISESFATMGGNVVWRLRSLWQVMTPSHHSCQTSLSMAAFSSVSAVSILGSMCLMRVRNRWNTPCTGWLR